MMLVSHLLRPSVDPLQLLELRSLHCKWGGMFVGPRCSLHVALHIHMAGRVSRTDPVWSCSNLMELHGGAMVGHFSAGPIN